MDLQRFISEFTSPNSSKIRPPPPSTDADDDKAELFKVVATATVSNAREGRLTFTAGEQISVLEWQDSGWCYGLIGEREGYFASKFVRRT